MTIGFYGESTKRAKRRKILATGMLVSGTQKSKLGLRPGLVPATGATAGIPGTWTPAGSVPPATPADLTQGRPVTVAPSPSTPWTSNQFVQTRTAGAAGRATWSGVHWVSGIAP